MKKKKKRREKPAKRKVVKKTAKKKAIKKLKKAERVTKKKKAQKPQKKTAKKSIIPPGASLEEIGVVSHYFPKVEAAVVKLTKGSLSLGDTIIIKGHTTEFKEKVDSLQLDHASISNASTGQEVGLRVKSKVREHDVVYKLIV
ncbi:MAG: hypothetical protein KJ957_01850 [Candidatus Omnitrophica bacterium]|nr:hypothetical protein [Candidatus Omnitrophota bacterium]